MIGDIAHVCNRGVEKRKIFLDQNDYFRFATNLIFLNNIKGKIRIQSKKPIDNIEKILFGQEKLVEVLKWSLLPNHYHLLLYEVVDGGILEFTKRLGNAYTKYFNTKYSGRSGYLFQNSAKMIIITDESQFNYIPIYIDLNCVDIYKPNWKVQKNRDFKKIINFLESYKWSSFNNYFGNDREELRIIINKNLFYSLFESNKIKYLKEIKVFIEDPINQSTWQVD